MNESHDDAVSVELPLARQRTWVAVLRWIAFVVLIAFYAYFCVTYVRDTLHRGFGIGMCFMWLAFGINALWWSSAKQLLSVSETTLTITTSSLGLRRVKKYATNQISYLRIQQSGLSGVPKLAFDRENGTNYWGRKLKTDNPQHLLDNVYARFPQLREMKSYFSTPNFPSDELAKPAR
jgi:hypothetical protein